MLDQSSRRPAGAEGRSANQGAESVICYLLARIALERLALVPLTGRDATRTHARRPEVRSLVWADRAAAR